MVQQDEGTGSAALAACGFTQIRRQTDRQTETDRQTVGEGEEKRSTDKQTDQYDEGMGSAALPAAVPLPR